MAYYVLGPGGSKHGPAELHTLSDWVSEGRIAPETLVEDIGSGTKMPARAVPGLQFAGHTAQPPPMLAAAGQPPASLGAPTNTPLAPSPTHMPSNYVATGGSRHNLFLPSADSNWAIHGLLAAVGGLVLGVLMSLMTARLHFEIGHFEVGRLSFLSLGLSIFGARCGYTGLNRGESGRGAFVIGANVVSFIASLAFMIWGVANW